MDTSCHWWSDTAGTKLPSLSDWPVSQAACNKTEKKRRHSHSRFKQGMGIRTCNSSFHGVALYQVQTGSEATFLGDKILAAEMHYQEHIHSQVMPSWGQTWGVVFVASFSSHCHTSTWAQARVNFPATHHPGAHIWKGKHTCQLGCEGAITFKMSANLTPSLLQPPGF